MRYALCASRHLGGQYLVAGEGKKPYNSPGARHKKIPNNQPDEEKSYFLEKGYSAVSQAQMVTEPTHQKTEPENPHG